MSQQETKDMARYFFRASAADFKKVPGSPVAYWVSERFRTLFSNYTPLREHLITRQGLASGDNDQFNRLWPEVNADSIASLCNVDRSNKKWFFFIKGGEYRKWYGNIEQVVNWEYDGYEIKNLKDDNGKLRSRPQSVDYYFRENIICAALTTGKNAFRYTPQGGIFDVNTRASFTSDDRLMFPILVILNSSVMEAISKILSPTMAANIKELESTPIPEVLLNGQLQGKCKLSIELAKRDWDAYETSWDFLKPDILNFGEHENLFSGYRRLRNQWSRATVEAKHLEEESNRLIIETYGLQDELSPDVQLGEVTLTCNPRYRYSGNRSEAELETLLQCDTLRELVFFAIGCMMGRFSLDKPGLILASQGEMIQDYLDQIPSPSFEPDENAILPLTDQEWFPDDATNRFREFVRVVWGDEHLQEDLDFVAESLCLHAIKPKRDESALDTIRRYLSTQFYKDHLRTYKKRPIYWLFSSGKHKAFECLVYLHRYNEGTLARMRTEYVIPLSAKLNSYAEKLEQDKEASTSAAETKSLEKEIATLHKQQAELAEFDEKLRHYADQRISLDLDDGVKVNYGKFGDLLAEVKAVTGQK